MPNSFSVKAAIYTRVSTEEQARGGVSLAGFLLIFLFVPTVSTYRLVAFITCMFAVTGALLVGETCLWTPLPQIADTP